MRFVVDKFQDGFVVHGRLENAAPPPGWRGRIAAAYGPKDVVTYSDPVHFEDLPIVFSTEKQGGHLGLYMGERIRFYTDDQRHYLGEAVIPYSVERRASAAQRRQAAAAAGGRRARRKSGASGLWITVVSVFFAFVFVQIARFLDLYLLARSGGLFDPESASIWERPALFVESFDQKTFLQVFEQFSIAAPDSPHAWAYALIGVFVGVLVYAAFQGRRRARG